MKDARLFLLAGMLLVSAYACTSGWRNVAVDAAVCTVEKAAEEAKKRGDLTTAARLEVIAVEQQNSEGGGGSGGR
jgi:hypothetical protein